MIKVWIYLLIIFQILQVKVKEVRRMTAIVKASNKGKASNEGKASNKTILVRNVLK